VWTEHRVLILYHPGDAHSVWLFWRQGELTLRNWYINLEAPWRRSPVGFDTRDHTLDLIVAPDLRSWEWKDEDELAWAQEAGRFSAAEAQAIRVEGERVLERIRRRAPPFCDGWERWEPDPAWTVPTLPVAWRVRPE
jgi:predicted RNA-binding protein associated with RNAse of E/G family